MPEYEIEIAGIMTVFAEDADEAIETVKNKFYDEILSIDDLHIDAKEVID